MIVYHCPPLNIDFRYFCMCVNRSSRIGVSEAVISGLAVLPMLYQQQCRAPWHSPLCLIYYRTYLTFSILVNVFLYNLICKRLLSNLAQALHPNGSGDVLPWAELQGQLVHRYDPTSTRPRRTSQSCLLPGCQSWRTRWTTWRNKGREGLSGFMRMEFR